MLHRAFINIDPDSEKLFIFMLYLMKNGQLYRNIVGQKGGRLKEHTITFNFFLRPSLLFFPFVLPICSHSCWALYVALLSSSYKAELLWDKGLVICFQTQ
jgi:hypothetical protein